MKEKDIKIISVSKETESQAKKLIVNGLSEYFDYYDESKNPDLNNIVDNYIKQGDIFLVGIYNENVICTGGLIKENNNTGRIVRMSVKNEFRRKGIATKMLKKLELKAIKKEYKKIVLETTKDWSGAISFYKANGYTEYSRDENDVYFKKVLSD